MTITRAAFILLIRGEGRFVLLVQQKDDFLHLLEFLYLPCISFALLASPGSSCFVDGQEGRFVWWFSNASGIEKECGVSRNGNLEYCLLSYVTFGAEQLSMRCEFPQAPNRLRDASTSGSEVGVQRTNAFHHCHRHDKWMGGWMGGRQRLLRNYIIVMGSRERSVTLGA